MIRCAGRNRELPVDELRDANLLLGRLLREDHPDPGPIGARFAVRRVVHLQMQHATGRQTKRRAGGKHLRVRPGRVGGQQAADEVAFALRPVALTVLRP